VTDKTQKDELTVGQRVAIEINRAYAEGLIECGKQARKEGGKLGVRGNKRKTPSPTLVKGFRMREPRYIVAERSGVSPNTAQKLITIKRKRPDLFQRVFEGWYREDGKEMTINAVYRINIRGNSYRLKDKIKTGIYSTPGAQAGQFYSGASGSNDFRR